MYYNAMMIPFHTRDMQSLRENNFLMKAIDLQMTLNYEKNRTQFFGLFSGI